MGVAELLDLVDTASLDADVTLSTMIGDHQEVTHARLWRGQVLVDWEPDAYAGGCLLRPRLLRRLIALHASAEVHGDTLIVKGPGRVVASLSSGHADLVRRLGGARRLQLQAVLRFAPHGEYRGGEETYYVLEREKQVLLLRLVAQVVSRSVATNVARGLVIGPSSRV